MDIIHGAGVNERIVIENPFASKLHIDTFEYKPSIFEAETLYVKSKKLYN